MTSAEKAELILEHPEALWSAHGRRNWAESSEAECGCEAEFLIHMGCSLSWTGHKESLQAVS